MSEPIGTDQPTAKPRGPRPPILVSVITGFLGAGKTTLLNALLKAPGLEDTLVLINEFGEIGIDHLLTERVDDGVIELAAGCLCCTIRGDLISTLEDMLRRLDNGRIRPFRRVLIETTGLADPAPVLHTIMYHPYLMMRYRLDGVISTVDAINGMHTLDTHFEAVKQAAVADRIVLTKTDLAITPAQKAGLVALRARLKALNPSAPVLDAARGEAKAAALLETGLWSLDIKTPDVVRWLRLEAEADGTAHQHDDDDAPCDECGHGHTHEHHHHHHHHHDVNRHDEHIRAFSLVEDQAMPMRALDLFLDLLRSAHGPNLLRVKGIIKVRETPDQPVVIHGVQHVFHPPIILERWPDADHRTRIVFIVKDMDEQTVRGLFEAFAGVPRIGQPDMAALSDNPLSLRR